jgi:hypothetical protein
MNISIPTFKTLIGGDLSLASRYEVTIPIPAVIQEFKSSDKADENLILQPESINLPGRTFKTFEDETYGPPRIIPLREQYEPVVMTFPVSGNWRERSFFEYWMKEGIINPRTKTLTYTPKTNNGVSVTIRTLARDGYASSIFKLNEAYPLSIIPINMGFGMYNDYTRLQVTLAYRDYVYETYSEVWDSGVPRGANKRATEMGTISAFRRDQATDLLKNTTFR